MFSCCIICVPKENSIEVYSTENHNADITIREEDVELLFDQSSVRTDKIENWIKSTKSKQDDPKSPWADETEIPNDENGGDLCAGITEKEIGRPEIPSFQSKQDDPKSLIVDETGIPNDENGGDLCAGRTEKEIGRPEISSFQPSQQALKATVTLPQDHEEILLTVSKMYIKEQMISILHENSTCGSNESKEQNPMQEMDIAKMYLQQQATAAVASS